MYDMVYSTPDNSAQRFDISFYTLTLGKCNYCALCPIAND